MARMARRDDDAGYCPLKGATRPDAPGTVSIYAVFEAFVSGQLPFLG